MRAWWVVGAVAVACFVARCSCRDEPAREPARFATFNIENFPKDARQIDGAFAEIAGVHSGVVALQEIIEPDVFEREARRRLGEHWRFVWVDTRPAGERRPGHHNGVMFDSTQWKLLGSRVYDGTRLAGGMHKPVLDVRLQRGPQVVHVLVVHLVAMSEGRPIRKAQYAALRDIVRDVERAGEPVVVMGDFNATEPADRDDLATLARDTTLVWASEPLACTAFWLRDDGCPRSRLDHVLTTSSPASIRAAGACERDGCGWEPRCPLYRNEVSDHCPVVVTFE